MNKIRIISIDPGIVITGFSILDFQKTKIKLIGVSITVEKASLSSVKSIQFPLKKLKGEGEHSCGQRDDQKIAKDCPYDERHGNGAGDSFYYSFLTDKHHQAVKKYRRSHGKTDHLHQNKVSNANYDSDQHAYKSPEVYGVRCLQTFTLYCLNYQDNRANAHGGGQDLGEEVRSVVIDRGLAVLAGIPKDPDAEDDQTGANTDIGFFHNDNSREVTEAALRLLPIEQLHGFIQIHGFKGRYKCFFHTLQEFLKPLGIFIYQR